MTQNSLEGKVAVVTGSGRGIGKAVAMAYAAVGAAVCCTSRTEAEIKATAAEIGEKGGKALAVKADVTDRESVTQMFEKTAEAFGGVDIVFINAGNNFDRRSVEESVYEDWLATIEINLTGAYYCAKEAIPHLKKRGSGKIITVGSGMGHRGFPGSSAYSASKAGLWALTKVLAQELWQFNISVNELIPGPVNTSLTADLNESNHTVFAMDSEWVKLPEDVAPLALFLATQPNTGPTGQSYSLMRRPL